MSALNEDLEVAQGRWLGYLYAAAAILSPSALVVPHEPGYDPAGIVVVAVVAALTSALLLLLRVRLRGLAVHCVVALGAVLTTGIIHFTNGLPNAATLFYVWIVLFAFYFFDMRPALAHLALVLALYVLSAVWTNTTYPLAGNAIATAGALIGAGVIVATLRRRIETLMSALEESARTDELTQLPNRRAFDEDFRKALARSKRAGETLTLAMLDLDHFKQVNDRHGHPEGDRVLARFSSVVLDSIRAGDLPARVGGEEFAVLFIGADPEGGRRLAERVRSAVATAFAAEGPPMTVSIGLANWHPEQAVDTAELMRRADNALYEAKRGGRNQVVVFADERPGRSREGVRNEREVPLWRTSPKS